MSCFFLNTIQKWSFPMPSVRIMKKIISTWDSKIVLLKKVEDLPLPTSPFWAVSNLSMQSDFLHPFPGSNLDWECSLEESKTHNKSLNTILIKPSLSFGCWWVRAGKENASTCYFFGCLPEVESKSLWLQTQCISDTEPRGPWVGTELKVFSLKTTFHGIRGLHAGFERREATDILTQLWWVWTTTTSMSWSFWGCISGRYIWW